MIEVDLSASSGAYFARAGTHRTLLWRRWGPGALDLYIGLNPSAAGAHVDDATVRRWRGFSERRGASGFLAVNLHTLIATNQRELWALPRFRRNTDLANDWIQFALARSGGFAIACWGNIPHPAHARAMTVAALAAGRGRRLHCFGTTRSGCPRHPVRLPYSTPLEPFVLVRPNT